MAGRAGGFWILPGQRAAVYEQLGRQLKAGLPLSTALRNMARGPAPQAIATALSEARAHVEKGETLSFALALHPQAFPAHDVGFLHAGELSGSLPLSFQRLADDYRDRHRRSLDLLVKLGYPLGLLATTILALPLPDLFSGGLHTYLLEILPGVVLMGGSAAGLSWLALAPTAAGARRVVMGWLRHVPGLSGQLQQLALARMVRLLAACVSAGIPPGECFRAAGLATNDPVLAQACNAVAHRLERGGQSITMALGASSTVFPTTLRQIVATGEEAGELDNALERAAEEWEFQAQITLSMLFGAGRWAVVGLVFVFMGYRIIADTMTAMAPLNDLLK